MEYTEEQKKEFKERFAIRRRRQMLVFVPLIMFGILMLTGNERISGGLVLGLIPIKYYFGILSVAMICAVFFSLKNWRCPACNKHLGKGYNPKFCSNCGVELQ